jgi:hypothetical protein
LASAMTAFRGDHHVEQEQLKWLDLAKTSSA